MTSSKRCPTNLKYEKPELIEINGLDEGIGGWSEPPPPDLSGWRDDEETDSHENGIADALGM
ncbi:hypothetical protein ACFLQV_04240 [Calditrichota bacterium]